MAGEFIGELEVRIVGDSNKPKFKTLAPFGFRSDVVGVTVNVPIGFETDGCSVPREPIVYQLFGGKYLKSGTVHDKLYLSHEVDRDSADKILREMIFLESGYEAEAEAFYLAVHEFGASHWSPSSPLPEVLS